VVPESREERRKLKEQTGTVAAGTGNTSQQARADARRNPDFQVKGKDEVLDMTERLQKKRKQNQDRTAFQGDALQQETPGDIYQNNNNRPTDPLNNQTSNTNQTQQVNNLREDIRRNPDVGNAAVDLVEARNAPTNQQQERKDPVPGDPLANVLPDRDDKIRNVRQDANQPDGADFSDFSNLQEILFGDKNFGDSNKQDNFDFQDVERVADTATDAGLSEGELRTIVGEETGNRIAEDTKNFIDPENNPGTRFIGRGFAGLTSAGGEALDSFDNQTNFDTEDARTITETDVDEFSDVVGGTIADAVALPLQAQRRGGQAQQIQSGELTGQEAANSTVNTLKATAQYAGNNPGKFAAGAGTGFLLGGPVRPGRAGKVTSNTFDKAKETGKKTGRKLDPATGIGRERLPGEETPTTPEKLRSEADNFVGFLKGDIQPETNRRPDARDVKIDTDPDGVRFEDQQATEDTFVNPLELDENADRVVMDERGDIPVEVTERNRRDVVNEKFDALRQDVNDRLNSGAVGLGPGALLKDQDLVEKPRDPLNGRREKDLVDGNLRQPDNDGPTLRDRIDRDPRNRNRRTEFNKPEPDTGQVNGFANSVGLGLGAGQDQGQDPFLEDFQDQGQDQPIDNPVKEETPLKQDNPPINDLGTGFDNFLKEEPVTPKPKQRREERRDRRRRRRKDIDVDFKFDRQTSQEPLQDDFVGGSEEGEFASSLTAGLFNIEASEDFEEEDFLGTGLEIRPRL